jgi:hypothetical protein
MKQKQLIVNVPIDLHMNLKLLSVKKSISMKSLLIESIHDILDKYNEN